MIILQANKIERSFAGELLFDNINLQVDESDRIALVGKNGAGKSTLLKILVGEEEPTSGQINKKRDLSLSYLAQDSRFESENTIYDEMLLVFDSLRQQEKRLRQMELQMGELSGEDLTALMTQYDQLSEDFRQKGGFTYEADIRAILNGFKFDQSMWQMKISELSGGQNTRLALAKMLLEKPELLVLDEPTNHLDIETIAWLETYLINYSGALIIVSHDRYFLDKVASKILAFENGGIRQFYGNYTDYLDEKKFELEMVAENSKPEKEKVVKVREEKKRMSYQEKQEWASIEREIEEIENKIAAIEAEMNENGSDFGKLANLQRQMDEENEQLLAKYERYEYLSELAEN